MTSAINTASLSQRWANVEFEFKAFNKSGKRSPDVSIIGGAFAFRRELKDLIFPNPSMEIEFFSILVSGDEWLLTNCLKETSLYDRENSILYRREGGQIFMINYVIVNDPSVKQSEVFVLEDSNHSTLLVLPAFVKRIVDLRLEGVEFREIGAIA